MDKFNFFKELYFKEVDKRYSIFSSLNIPMAIITIIATAIFYIISNFDFKNSLTSSLIFLVLIAASVSMLMIAILFLIKAFGYFTKDYSYQEISYPNDLIKWYNELLEYYDKKEDAELYFENAVLDKIMTTTTINMVINENKHRFLFKSIKFIVLSFILTIFALIPFERNYFYKKEVLNKIEFKVNSQNIKEFNKE